MPTEPLIIVMEGEHLLTDICIAQGVLIEEERIALVLFREPLEFLLKLLGKSLLGACTKQVIRELPRCLRQA